MQQAAMQASLFADLPPCMAACRYRITDPAVVHLDGQAQVAWKVSKQDATAVSLSASSKQGASVTLSLKPFKLEVSSSGQPAVTLNSRGLFDFEHRRTKEVRSNHQCTAMLQAHHDPACHPSALQPPHPLLLTPSSSPPFLRRPPTRATATAAGKSPSSPSVTPSRTAPKPFLSTLASRDPSMSTESPRGRRASPSSPRP
jgi:hypothetical protein